VEFVADGAYNTFDFGLSLRPAKARLYEYSYEKNEQFRSATSQQRVPGIQGHPFGSFALEQSEKLFTDELHISAEMLIASASALDEEAKTLKTAKAGELVTLTGQSDNPALRVGGLINVSGEGLGSRHITAESFGKYRLITISHHVDAAGNYSNEFTAIPHFLEVPPLCPSYNPPSGTPELAEVIDDNDPQKLGRLRVRYQWPVDNPRDAETDWIRLLTPYSGDGKGQLFKPEVGSQVLIGYQNGLAEQPFVLGNMFHAKNKQSAKYSPDKNSMKGIQTAGGNKFVMLDKAGEQKIHISNSNNKGTAITVGFQGDGSVHIHSNGPVTVNGSVITLDAGAPGKDQTKFTGAILMRAKTITLEAEEEITATSFSKSIALAAQMNITADATADLTLSAKGISAIGSKGMMEISSDASVAVSGTAVEING
jgi:uncharacterized protein involved in type VI secretion and phage assembly